MTVGDRFQALLRVSAPPGARVEFPALPPAAEAVQALDSVRVVSDPSAPDTQLAIYPLVAWQTGELALPPLAVRVTLRDGTAEIYRVALRLPSVQSVLPPGEVEPRGAKDVIDPEGGRAWLVPLLLLLGLLLAVAAYLLWRLRNRTEPEAQATPRSPREEALATLERARALGRAEAGEWKPFFSLVSAALRGYLAELSPRWSGDLTTRELLRTLEAEGIEQARVAALREVLERADRVKFARYRPSEAEAEATWEAARDWVQAAEPTPTVTATEREAA